MSKTIPYRMLRTVPKAFALFALVLQLACTIRLVSAYDEALDKGTSAVHTRIATFVARMTTLAGQPEGSYDANRGFYAEVAGEIATLRLRAEATAKNEITLKLFDELQGNFERLRVLHESAKAGGLPSVLAKPAMSAISINCGAILKLEIAKKRGEKD